MWYNAQFSFQVEELQVVNKQYVQIKPSPGNQEVGGVSFFL